MGMFRTPAKPPRKDFNREKVIIHENADDSIRSHLVRIIFIITLSLRGSLQWMY